MSPSEIKETKIYMQNLRDSLTSNNKDSILKAHEDLNTFSQPFAERLMDKAISMAIKGKTINGI